MHDALRWQHKMHNHSTCKEFVSFLHIRLSMNAFFVLLISFLGAFFTAAILRAVTKNIQTAPASRNAMPQAHPRKAKDTTERVGLRFNFNTQCLIAPRLLQASCCCCWTIQHRPRYCCCCSSRHMNSAKNKRQHGVSFTDRIPDVDGIVPHVVAPDATVRPSECCRTHVA